jgi:hypothetical protein
MSPLLGPLALLIYAVKSAGRKDLTTYSKAAKKHAFAAPPKKKLKVTPRPPGPPKEVYAKATQESAPVQVVPAATTATQVPKTAAPVPWPQVVPAGLPPFPGIDWTPDTPPGAGVAVRAAQLLPELWSHGEGTSKIEQTAGRWIAYRAVKMGDKKGVVAYRQKAETTLPTGVVPASTSAPSPAPAAAPTQTLNLPTLKEGSRGKDVQVLQTRLGLSADGIFGPKTKAAVIAYQGSHGLKPDGIVGTQTWHSLFATQV